jgi:putative PIN family toxin of toxin-antitoxin system
MRIVVDTNVLISRALSNRGAPARIIEQWVEGAFELVISEDILDEYERVLGYERIQKNAVITAEQIIALLSKIEEAGTLVIPSETLSVVDKDPDDNKFLECAIAGAADYIVSGDAHLLSLGEYQGVRILSPADFLDVLNHPEVGDLPDQGR